MTDNLGSRAMIMEYGKMLARYIDKLCRDADRLEDKETAKKLRDLAAAMQWAVEASIPRFVVLDFEVVYKAAQKDDELYAALVKQYGSEQNVEIAANYRGIKERAEWDF